MGRTGEPADDGVGAAGQPRDEPVDPGAEVVGGEAMRRGPELVGPAVHHPFSGRRETRSPCPAGHDLRHNRPATHRRGRGEDDLVGAAEQPELEPATGDFEFQGGQRWPAWLTEAPDEVVGGRVPIRHLQLRLHPRPLTPLGSQPGDEALLGPQLGPGGVDGRGQLACPLLLRPGGLADPRVGSLQPGPLLVAGPLGLRPALFGDKVVEGAPELLLALLRLPQPVGRLVRHGQSDPG